MRQVAFAVWIAFFVLAFGIPFANLLMVSGSHAFSIRQLFASETLAVVRATAIQASISTLLALGFGAAGGLLWARSLRTGSELAHRLRFILVITFSLPAVVVAQAALSSGHVLGMTYGFWLIVFAHVLINGPWVAFSLSEILLSLPTEWFDAARVLGAKRSHVLRDIVFRHAGGEIARLAALVFSWCASSFALVLILGGGPPNQTLETEVYARLRYSGLDVSQAESVALWLFVVLATPHLVVYWVDRRTRLVWRRAARSFRFVAEKRRLTATALLGISFAAVLCVAPLIGFFDRNALRELGRVEFLKEISWPFAISVQIAVLTMLLSLVLGTIGVYVVRRHPIRRAAIESTFSLTASMSMMLLGAALCLTYIDVIDSTGGSVLGTIVLQSLAFSPFVFRNLSEMAFRWAAVELDAARTLGADPWQAFVAVEWPRYRARFFQVAMGVFFFSLADVSAVSLFSGPRTETLSRKMMQLMTLYRFDEARAIGIIFLVLAIVASYAIFQVRVGRDARN